MIKVISYGTKGKIKTAQVVFIHNGKSMTIHLWHRHGKVYGDWIGNNYEL